MTQFRVGMSVDDLITLFQTKMVPIETVAMVLGVCVFVLSKRFHVYDEFPGTLFLWLLPVDICYGLLAGPLRWLVPALGDVRVMSDSSCRWSSFVDTFFQMCSMYLNTAIITVVFYMVFYTTTFHGSEADVWRKRTGWGLLVFALPLSFAAAATSTYRGAGWCINDELPLIIKQALWWVLLFLQTTMVVPTQYKIYKSSLISSKRISWGTYLRFCGIIATQFVGFAPLLYAELQGFNRQFVTAQTMRMIAFGFPCAHLLDAVLMGMRPLPYLLPIFQRLLSLESTHNKNSSQETHAKHTGPKGKEKATHSGTDHSHPSHGPPPPAGGDHPHSLHGNPANGQGPATLARVRGDTKDHPERHRAMSDGALSQSDGNASGGEHPHSPELPARHHRSTVQEHHSIKNAPADLPQVMEIRTSTKFKLFFKLFLYMSFPAGFTLATSFYLIYQRQLAVKAGLQMYETASAIPFIADYNHAIQEEMIVSSVFSLTNKTEMKETLPICIKESETAAENLFEFLAKHNAIPKSNATADLQRSSAVLSSLRTKYNDSEWQWNASTLAYSQVAKDITNLLLEASQILRSNTTAAKLVTYAAAFDSGLEFGDEGVTAAQIFANQLSVEDLPTFGLLYSMNANISAHFDLFSFFATAKNTEAHSEFLRTVEKGTNFYRSILYGQNSSEISSIDFTDFLGDAIGRIDAYGKFMSSLEQDVATFADSRMVATFAQVGGYLTLLIFTSYFICLCIYHGVSLMTGFIQRFGIIRRQTGAPQKKSLLGYESLWKILKSRLAVPLPVQILITQSVALVGLWAIFLANIHERIGESHYAVGIRDNLGVCTYLSDFALQINREAMLGTSYMLLQPSQEAIRVRLEDQEKIVDDSWRNLQSFLAKTFTNTAVQSTTEYQQLFARFRQLSDLRSQALDSKISVAVYASFFEEYRDLLSALVSLLAANTRAETIDHSTFSYLQFVYAKRYIAKTRESIVTAALQGQFSRESFLQVLEYIAAYRVGVDSTLAYSPLKAEVGQVFASPAYQVLVQNVLDYTAIDPSQIAHSEWADNFLFTTKLLNFMRKVEDDYVANLKSFARNQVETNTRSLEGLWSLLSLIGVFSVLLEIYALYKVYKFAKSLESFVHKQRSTRRVRRDTQPEGSGEHPGKSTPNEIEMSPRSKRANSAPEVCLQVEDFLFVSELLCLDSHRANGSTHGSAHGGTVRKHQEVLNFYVWVSTFEGFVACNNWMYEHCTDQQFLSFWKDMNELKALAKKNRQNDSQDGELEVHHKAEEIYEKYIKGKVPVGLVPTSLATTTRGRGATLARSRSMTLTNSSPTDTSRKVDQPNASPVTETRSKESISNWRQRVNVSLQPAHPGVSLQWFTETRSHQQQPPQHHRPGTVDEDLAEASSTPFGGSPNPSSHGALLHRSPDQSSHGGMGMGRASGGASPLISRRFSLGAVINDPNKLEALQRYCRRFQCEENIEFVLRVRAFVSECHRLESLPVRESRSGPAAAAAAANAVPQGSEQARDLAESCYVNASESEDQEPGTGRSTTSTVPVALLLAADEIFKAHLAPTAQRKINVSAEQSGAVERALANPPNSIKEFSKIFDAPYAQVRTMLMHNILENLLIATSSSSPTTVNSPGARGRTGGAGDKNVVVVNASGADAERPRAPTQPVTAIDVPPKL